MRLWMFRWALVCCALALLLGCAPTPPSSAIVLVTVAGLRSDALDSPAAPRLAALARSGSASRSTVTPCPDAGPALAALMTGEDPERLGALFTDLMRLPARSRTLAERLRQRGYATQAFVGQGAVSILSGLGRGFQGFAGASAPTAFALLPDEPERVRAWREGSVPAPELAELAAGHLRARAGSGPVFLWVHLGDLVRAVDPQAPRASYDDALRQVDQAIGALADAFAAPPVSGHGAVIVASVHGMALGEHGEVLHGLFLGDSVARTAVVFAGGLRDVTPSASLTGVRSQILKLVGAEPEGAAGVGADAAISVTAWPSRLYGWADLRRGAGDAPSSPPVDHAAVLEGMAAAHVALAQGRAEEAVARLEEVARLAPAGLAPRLALARALTSLIEAGGSAAEGAKDRRARVFADAERLIGGSMARRLDVARALQRAGEDARALALVQSAPADALTPGTTIAAAELLTDAGAVEGAADLVMPLAETDPEAPELYEWVGDLLLRAGNAYRARVAFEKAIRTPRGRTANVLAKLGDCLAQLGEADAALQRFAEAVLADPAYRYPHRRASDILLAQGKDAAAADALVKSLRATGNEVQDALQAARALQERGLLPAAAATLDRALARQPEAAGLEIALARVLLAGGKADDARRRLTALTERRPELPAAWVELARVAAVGGDEAAAVAALDRAAPRAGPGLAEQVRGEALFRKFGAASRLARRAAAFSGRGEGPRRPASGR